MRKTFIATATAVTIFISTSALSAATLTLDSLRDLVTNLGYETTIDAASSNIGIADQAKAKVTIYFQLSADHTSVDIYAPFSDIADDKRPDMPMAALLKANNNSAFMFAISTVDNKDRLDLEASFDSASLTKQMLRKTIDTLVAQIDETQPIWDQDAWKKGGEAKATEVKAPEVKTLDAARADFEAAWERSPMRADNAMFVTEKASTYGAFTKRDTTTFKKGEALVAYLEPKCFAWKSAGNGLYDMGVGADLAILDSKGDVVYEKKKFFSQTFKSRDKFDDLMLNLTLTIDGLGAGSYSVRYTLKDEYSDKSTIVLLPFKIAE